MFGEGDNVGVHSRSTGFAGLFEGDVFIAGPPPEARFPRITLLGFSVNRGTNQASGDYGAMIPVNPQPTNSERVSLSSV